RRYGGLRAKTPDSPLPPTIEFLCIIRVIRITRCFLKERVHPCGAHGSPSLHSGSPSDYLLDARGPKTFVARGRPITRRWRKRIGRGGGGPSVTATRRAVPTRRRNGATRKEWYGKRPSRVADTGRRSWWVTAFC